MSELTLGIVRPGALGAANAILREVAAAGFTVVAQDIVTLSKERSTQLGIDGLLDGPCMPICLAKEGGVAAWTALIASAGEGANIHCSADAAAAQRELNFFFPNIKVDSLPSNAEAEGMLNSEVVPLLTKALVELCKNKPENPVVWLAGQLKGTNPNAQVDSTLGETESSKVEAAHEAFALIDADDDGLIDQQEFCGALRKLGLDIEQEQSDIIFSQIDRDGDGSINKAEFVEAFFNAMG